MLVPAVYNKKGIQGDFQIYVKGAGRLRLYTSVVEYFKYFPKAIYVYATLQPERDKNVFYKIFRKDVDNLDGLESLVNPPDFE